MNLPLDRLRRPAIIIGWGVLLVIVMSTLSPIGARPHIPEIGANTERFLAYLGAGTLLTFAYPRQRWLVLAGIIVLALGLEWLQTWEATRHGMVRDALVKSAGAIIGAGLSGIFDHMARRFRSPA